MLALNRWLQRFKAARDASVAAMVFVLLGALQWLPADRSLAFLDRQARRFGPWSARHQVALDNLRHAFPDMTEAKREAIALDMWGNMGRLMGEYIFMDKLFAQAEQGPRHERIAVAGVDHFHAFTADPRPRIFFTGHIGNFELLPIAAAGYGLSIVSLFRPPNNPFIASRLLRTRAARMGGLVSSRSGAALALARILDEGGSIGLLVDQKFQGGVKTPFFGRPCLTSPLLAKLARRADCPVHPAWCVRLPDGRFRIEIGDALDTPRDAAGDIDVEALTLLVTRVVEDRVRSDPGQWMWFHRRWDMPATG